MTTASLDHKDTPATDRADSSSSSTSSLGNNDDSKEQTLVQDVAKLGDGRDQELSTEQMDLIRQLYENTTELRNKLVEERSPDDDETWFANDHDTCRRYLVARQWKLEAAQAQLVSTLEWRRTSREGLGLDFWQSPKALDNPLSLSMRPVGWDKEGRPICYSSFSESHDRWDPQANNVHMTLLMEACCRMIHHRRQAGFNQTATSRQWVWVIDFDGFSWRDQNPKSGILTAQVMQHYPEMLHLAVLINAPFLFNTMFSLIQPFLDERVKSKIMFVKANGAGAAMEQFRQRLGDEAVDWILKETNDNHSKKADAKAGNPKQYWIPPKASDQQHDARGMESYVDSNFYVKTPGDAYLESQLQDMN